MKSSDLPSLSIIIPTLNESENLQQCLASIPNAQNIEVIVCDGDSEDDTTSVAMKYGAKVIDSQRGRAAQMNAAAAVAKNDVLLFLHADTILPTTAADAILSSMIAGHSMGCFERKFDSNHWLLKITSHWAGWRARKTFIAYGDQAIFLRRDLFEQLEGYRELKRFEDLDLALRAKQRGSWAVLPNPVITDARRFSPSPWKQVLSDGCLTIAWLLGIIKE